MDSSAPTLPGWYATRNRHTNEIWMGEVQVIPPRAWGTDATLEFCSTRGRWIPANHFGEYEWRELPNPFFQ
jgi:hypothetical protein